MAMHGVPGESGENSAAAEQPPLVEADEELMLAFAAGKAEAFRELFARYRQPVFGFFRRRVADAALAEELAQETFLAVLRTGAKYQPKALFRTWLYAIALKILHAHRRKAAFRAAFFGARDEEREPAGPSSLTADAIVRQAVARLDPMDREILLLREFEQLSYAEVAELLHLPANTVRSRLFRARRLLRELLSAPVRQESTSWAEKVEGML